MNGIGLTCILEMSTPKKCCHIIYCIIVSLFLKFKHLVAGVLYIFIGNLCLLKCALYFLHIFLYIVFTHPFILGLNKGVLVCDSLCVSKHQFKVILYQLQTLIPLCMLKNTMLFLARPFLLLFSFTYHLYGNLCHDCFSLTYCLHHRF